MKPWLVFYGTQVALVMAEDEAEAFTAFIQRAFPVRADGASQWRKLGRFVPPTLSEVKIRELRASDAVWIEEFDDRAAKPFREALRRAAQ